MKVNDYVNQVLGKVVWYEPKYGTQCVGAFKDFCQNYAGCGAYPTGNNFADGYWYQDSPDCFEKVSTNNLQNGDWVIWARGCDNEHGESHIAMYVDGKQLSQNQFGHDEMTLCDCTDWNLALGGLRWNGWENESHYIGYSAHVEDLGWMDEVYDGDIAGTTGNGKRLEALKIRTFDGSLVEYIKLHLQDIGWEAYNAPSADTVCGTVGESRRIEDVCIKLDGYKFRVHIQDTGWTPWTACDGISTLGTVGQSLRIEAIQISK